jgi:hypothetical protein
MQHRTRPRALLGSLLASGRWAFEAFSARAQFARPERVHAPVCGRFIEILTPRPRDSPCSSI